MAGSPHLEGKELGVLAPAKPQPVSCLSSCSDCLIHVHTSKAQANFWPIVLWVFSPCKFFPCFFPSFGKKCENRKQNYLHVLHCPVAASEILSDSVPWAKVFGPQLVPLCPVVFLEWGPLERGCAHSHHMRCGLPGRSLAARWGVEQTRDGMSQAGPC